ncbi:hypothetical protein I4U23_014545 [Adineta vaga]|nr:hypothetical protein I4U23_014545 [Adineta vaga]
MSEQNLIDENVDSDEDEDDDYCPTKTNQQHSDSSADSEDDNDETTEDKEKIASKNQLDVTPYDESKTDELWKNFTSSTTKVSDKSKPTTEQSNLQPKVTTKVFEYAGEKVSVPVKTPIATPTAAVATSPSLKRPATTSSSLLDRLGISKKQKLSTLEKSRLDWSAHKESEALIDDLDSHRRSKDSYVERKAFLERTEAREHDHYLTNAKKK